MGRFFRVINLDAHKHRQKRPFVPDCPQPWTISCQREILGQNNLHKTKSTSKSLGLRGWEFCTICPFFANFSSFTKISQVPSFQAHSPVKTVFRQNAKNARKSQNTPSTNPYQNETQFPLSSLKNENSGHARSP